MVAPTGQVENLPFGSFSFFLSWLLGMIIGGAVTTEFLNKSVLLISVDLLPCTAAYKLCPYHLLSAALDKVTDTFSNPSFLPLYNLDNTIYLFIVVPTNITHELWS